MTRRETGGDSTAAVAPGFLDGYFQNDRLTFSYQRSLVAWQFGDLRQIHPLHSGFNASQMPSANQNLVGGEDQLEILVISIAGQFGEHELIVW